VSRSSAPLRILVRPEDRELGGFTGEPRPQDRRHDDAVLPPDDRASSSGHEQGRGADRLSGQIRRVLGWRRLLKLSNSNRLPIIQYEPKLIATLLYADTTIMKLPMMIWANLDDVGRAEHTFGAG
jgi:hypothetical protein